MSYVSNVHFDRKERAWFEYHYSHSSSVVYSYGLKSLDGKDASEGKQIVAAVLEEEEQRRLITGIGLAKIADIGYVELYSVVKK
ncbi:hypothetical protein CLAFUW4_11008 [Fulvia fulva]|uniref:Uncharacterized protein n=1 Tax=Passalora fulva TaxID=5499 RepID=A0A9Q8PD67_PASFU|nr:uncharacterized protein CLAFUR5_10051 [Fulvia fulva]KAK4619813.1 hypothetical protein CLAFUR4_11013 [Fulvia fulva]KAK4621084.1 hypothetical protein CLAFUR0_11020 [Fulvia fulva]UJO20384.1 hypothetical protein CLAFUR5_10051 [Fulvia fulva]WPV17546.1 hypothetical protein CLAFUW4_11008 [Fulvia fulva]WPV32521.1 hypothetical protein CLAFUW7_11006 [Fulvia fulva]